MKFKIILIVIISLLWIYSSNAANSNDIQFNQQIDSIVRYHFDKLDMTGLGIAIVRNDSIIYEKNMGYRILPNQEFPEGETIENDDLYRIASVSKTFIATAILQLVEQGKFSLDDDAQKYLSFKLRNPQYPDVPITLKMLLTHTSSINDSRWYYKFDLINPTNDSDYVKCYSGYKPGTQYKYCNFNYQLLGAIIETVTNTRFDEYIDKNILQRCDVNRAGFDCSKLDSTKFVKIYRYKDDNKAYEEEKESYKSFSYRTSKYILGLTTSYLFPCGGLKISAHDLAKYMIMHMDGGKYKGLEIISRNSEQLMRNNYVGKYNYGYSFRNYNDILPSVTFYGQTGGIYGVKSAMIFDPLCKIGFIIISSGSKSKYIDGYGDIHKPIIKDIYPLL